MATLLVEYGVLGLLAGLLGSAAAIALTWAVSKYGLEITWRFVPSVNLLGVAVALVLVMVVGVASSWDVLVKKPLGFCGRSSRDGATQLYSWSVFQAIIRLAVVGSSWRACLGLTMTALEKVQIVPLTQLDDGTIIVTGTGIALEIIIARHNVGDTPLEIQEGFPALELADIYSVIAYYLSHRAEVDAYVSRQKKRTQASRERFESDSAVVAHLAEVRARIRDFRSA